MKGSSWKMAPDPCMHACMCVSLGGETGREENGCRTRDKTVVITETRAFGFSVLRGSIICNRETVGQKTCAIKKAVAFEAVSDSMVHRCLNERRAYKGRGSIGGWNCGVFRLACSKSLAEATTRIIDTFCWWSAAGIAPWCAAIASRQASSSMSKWSGLFGSISGAAAAAAGPDRSQFAHARAHTRQEWVFEKIRQELSPETCNEIVY